MSHRASKQAKHVQTGSNMSSVVPMKGVTHEFPAKRIRAFCKEMGLENADIVMKGDQEPAVRLWRGLHVLIAEHNTS